MKRSPSGPDKNSKISGGGERAGDFRDFLTRMGMVSPGEGGGRGGEAGAPGEREPAEAAAASCASRQRRAMGVSPGIRPDGTGSVPVAAGLGPAVSSETGNILRGRQHVHRQKESQRKQ